MIQKSPLPKEYYEEDGIKSEKRRGGGQIEEKLARDKSLISWIVPEKP
jgi:hypothetical protein